MRIATNVTLLCTTLATLSALGCAGDSGHPHPHVHEDDHEAHEDEHAHGHGHDHGGHGHGHGEDAIGITRYTNKLELFAEHPPAIAGQDMPFLAHLTLLSDFSALQDATVTLNLDGPAHAEATVTEMLRPGIFQPVLKAPAAGTCQGSLVVKGPRVEDTIDGFEVVVHADAAAAKQASAVNEDATGAEPIAFLKEQQWQIPFGTAFAEVGQMVPGLEVSGEVTTPPSGQAVVGAAIAGRVVAPRGGLPRPGQAVHKGELLATIAPAPTEPGAAARADLAVVEAEARKQAADAELERAERLIADRAISQRKVDEARREARVAEQAVTAARRAKSVFTSAVSGHGAGTYRVTAPIDGVIVDVEATEGKPVSAGDPLLHIVNLDELWIRARVPEQDAARIRPDEDAAFQLQGLDDWVPMHVAGDSPDARVVYLSRVVDPRSRTVDIIYALQKPDPRLRVGAAVQVTVPAGEPWQGVVVPSSSLLDDDGRSVAYVQVEGEAFEERAVREGPRSGGRVGIVSGLRAGERIVTLGANLLRLASRAGSSVGHGHVH